MCLGGLVLHIDGGHGRGAPEAEAGVGAGLGAEPPGGDLELEAEDGRLEAVLVLDGGVVPQVGGGRLEGHLTYEMC